MRTWETPKMPKQQEFGFMRFGKFRERWKNIFVIDFEFANIGGALLPTSYAVKNLKFPKAKTEFVWLRNEDGTVRKDLWNPFQYGMRGPNDDFMDHHPLEDESCFYELGWKSPSRIIDLYTEIKILKNGLWNKFSLLDVTEKLGIKNEYLEDDKTNLRERLGKDLVKEDEKATVERYNVEDVEVTTRLYDHIEKIYDEEYAGGEIWQQALKRGQTTRIAAEIGRRGYPIDVEAWVKFRKKFDAVIEKVLEETNQQTGCFPIKNGKRKFDNFKFATLVDRLGLTSWPRTKASNALITDQETFRSFENVKLIKMIKDALYLKNSTKLKDMPVDWKDGRAKTYASYYGTKTQRATPSTSRHLPNMPPCFIPFMVPRYDKPIFKIDYEQQEFAIAAVLSGDKAMLESYLTGDPYLSLGKKANVIPNEADKTHPMRDAFKTVCLKTQYGAGARTMALDMDKPIEVAEMLLQNHQRVFHKFWKWQEEYMDMFMVTGGCTLPGDSWNYKIEPGTTFRAWGETKGYSINTIKNWIIQSTGAQILYEAVRLLDEDGYKIIGTMHDEIIIEGNSVLYMDGGSAALANMQRIMEQASYNIIGFRIRTEGSIHEWSKRMKPKKKTEMDLFNFIATESGIDLQGVPSINEDEIDVLDEFLTYIEKESKSDDN